MTDLSTNLPSFPVEQYSHLLPSIEKNLITTSDLLTLEAVEIAKRAQLPLLDLKRLIAHVLASSQVELGLDGAHNVGPAAGRFADLAKNGEPGWGKLRTNGRALRRERLDVIKLGDEQLDAALGGGVPTGYVTEFVGESGAAKTQLLLILLLTAQMPTPQGLGRPTLYVTTEHALPTPRLTQLIRSHPLFASLEPASRPSLEKILSISTPDLESQDHILQYQVPVALQRHNIGLVVIDSIAANYRAEKTSSSQAATGKGSRGEALAERSAQLVQLGALLRKLAREHNCAIVVANQVSDRFSAAGPSLNNGGVGVGGGGKVPSSSAIQQSGSLMSSSPASSTQQQRSIEAGQALPPNVLSLDHQLKWFSGWGDGRKGSAIQGSGHAEKTPALGLTWANQVDCRVALIKEAGFPERAGIKGATEWAPRRWRRLMKVVYSPWVAPIAEGEEGVKFEVWEGGLRAL